MDTVPVSMVDNQPDANNADIHKVHGLQAPTTMVQQQQQQSNDLAQQQQPPLQPPQQQPSQQQLPQQQSPPQNQSSTQNVQQITPMTESHNNVQTSNKQEQQSQSLSPSKAVVTKVKLSDELNLFDWSRATDIISQIAERANNSVASVITVLDPGMKEYLYSGGQINIIVISDSNHIVSPVRDAFQNVFGRATVSAAKQDEFPVRLACGFDEAIIVAQERIKNLRLDTSNVPRNQVVAVVQPSLVSILKQDGGEGNLSPKWFLTYSMVIEDPVLGTIMNSFSQFIPIDPEIVPLAREAKFPDGFAHGHLGFAKSIDELMIARLNLTIKDPEQPNKEWIHLWTGLEENRIIQDLGLSLAHLYRRRWANETAKS